MDPEVAKEMFERGALLVLLDVPSHAEIGIDMYSWTVTEKVKGIKMIPPGLHFIYYSCRDQTGNPSPRAGFFSKFAEKDVIVRKWNSAAEEFSMEITDEVELSRYRENKKELDCLCLPYPYETYKTYISLTSNITENTVNRINPQSGTINSSTLFKSESSDSSERLTNPGIYNSDSLTIDPHYKMNYISVQRSEHGQSGTSITSNNMDSIVIIESILSSFKDQMSDSAGENSSWMELLAELQMSFICFLVGQQYDSFEHWKKLIGLLCNSERAVNQYSELYTEFLSTVHHQIKQVPEDFFTDITTRENFLVSTLANLFHNIQEADCPAALKSRSGQFKKHLISKYSWSFTDEEFEDEQPVVVDLNSGDY